MSGHWLVIEPIIDPDADPKVQVPDSKKQFKVRYSYPGLGFACDKIVDGEMADLLKVAIEEGKNQHAAEMRRLLRLR